jgi:predicted O-methyltransferase YrrM
MPYITDIPGWMLETELQEIEKLSKLVPKNGVIVEVGSLCGKSSVCWAMNADPSVTIYCHDIFYERIEIDKPGIYYNSWELFNKNISNFKNIIPVRGFCPSQTKYEDHREIDLFFIDAKHKNPEDWNIIKYFLPYIRKDGIICGHDFYLGPDPLFPDVIDNVNNLSKMFNNEPIIKDTLWCLIKK